jgi:hypothetical protein
MKKFNLWLRENYHPPVDSQPVQQQVRGVQASDYLNSSNIGDFLAKVGVCKQKIEKIELDLEAVTARGLTNNRIKELMDFKHDIHQVRVNLGAIQLYEHQIEKALTLGKDASQLEIIFNNQDLQQIINPDKLEDISTKLSEALRENKKEIVDEIIRINKKDIEKYLKILMDTTAKLALHHPEDDKEILNNLRDKMKNLFKNPVE